MNSTVKFFKVIALLEGISFLVILGITMPLKYTGISELPNKISGMAHGLLFILYVILAFAVKSNRNWSFKQLMIVQLASLVPFGTFYIDKKYLRD